MTHPPPPRGPADAPPIYLEARDVLAAQYLSGQGLEIGALHQPLAIPPDARVRYVDRFGVDELRREYPELAEWDLTEVDLIDDGEQLTTVAEGSQDFIVANHFLEHCEDPIGAIEVHLRKLKPGGILFYAVPDKRYTFDFRRPCTPLEEIVADHEQGPERSRRDHYEEWARLVEEEGSGDSPAGGERTAAAVIEKARQLESSGYSIHMHVWTQAEFLDLILYCMRHLEPSFDIEAAVRRSIEFIVVLRKAGKHPDPPSRQLMSTSRRETNESLEQELLDLKASASWRLTKPLRAAKSLLRSRASRGAR